MRTEFTTPTAVLADTVPLSRFWSSYIDWEDSQTDLAHLGGAAPGAAKSGGDKLWEDNWDDDDIEDDFSLQLRSVILPLLLFVMLLRVRMIVQKRASQEGEGGVDAALGTGIMTLSMFTYIAGTFCLPIAVSFAVEK